jgi:hypothetical protein
MMRTTFSTCVGLLALCAISAQAAPLPPTKAGPIELAISPPIERVVHGCGYGQRRTQWQDHWGHWHWGRCVTKTWGSLSRHQFSQ